MIRTPTQSQNTSALPSIQQQRNNSRPRHLKGKFKYWRLNKKEMRRTAVNVDTVESEMRVSTVKAHEGSLAERKEQTRRYNWEPRTEFERMFQRKMLSLTRYHNFPPPSFINELLEAVSSQQELRFALKVWYQLSIRRRSFDESTTKLLVQKAYEHDFPDVAQQVLENAAVLRMPIGTETWDIVLTQDKESFSRLYQNALETKVLRPDGHHSVVARLLAAGLPEEAQELTNKAAEVFEKRKQTMLSETQQLLMTSKETQAKQTE